MAIPANPQLPAYLQQQTWKPLQQYQQQLGGMFDTSGLESSYNQAISGNYDQGRALAASAAAQYANRASQVGASALGAGFARGQAMLPVYQQGYNMLADLQSKKLQSQTAQAGIGADLASRIGQLQSARQGTVADYYNNQAKLQQSQQQFNQDLGFRNQQLAQNQSQFDTTNQEHTREFNQTFGQQSSQDAITNRLRALQLSFQAPKQSFHWDTNGAGNPATPFDQQQQQSFFNYRDFLNNRTTQTNNMLSGQF